METKITRFAKWIAENNFYTHNENCFTIPNGKTLTSEMLVDEFEQVDKSQDLSSLEALFSNRELKIMCADYFAAKPKEFDNMFSATVEISELLRDKIFAELKKL